MDDLVLIVESVGELRESVDMERLYMKTKELKVNIGKTKVVVL